VSVSKPKTYQIPFAADDKHINMLEWTSAKPGQVRQPGGPGWNMPDEWRDVYEFDAELVMTSWSKGRSSARFNVQNHKLKETYSLAMSGFYDAIKAFGMLPGGIIQGRWTFRKQGSNYALVPVIV